MSLFKVKEIIDGDTIRVEPNWTWNSQQGDTIKIMGYTTPSESMQQYAVQKLRNLIFDKYVELKVPQVFSHGSSAIACRVFLNGIDISGHFPEFQQKKGF